MHELKECASFHWVCWRERCAQPPWCPLGTGPLPPCTLRVGCFPRPSRSIRGAVPTSAVKVLVGLCLKNSGKRSLLTEQMPSSGSLTWRTDLRKPDHSFTLKTIVFNWLSGCFVCMGHLPVPAKSTRLLSPFPTQTGCVYTDKKFVFTCFLVVILRRFRRHHISVCF